MESSQNLIDRIRAYDPGLDAARFDRAFAFGLDAHEGQTRASGEPYYTHPIAVANILIDMRLDVDTIVTALLHDTVEDCGVTLETLNEMFGADVAQLVDGVTKLSRLAIKSSSSSVQAENFRKLLLAMSEDVRVLLVKLADRTHNMRTIQFFKNQEKQQRIARETMDIYAPLAERIGVTHMQRELEEASFGVLNPEMKQGITNRLDFMMSESEILIPMISVELQAIIERVGIENSVTGRIKSPYSIWRKMQKKAVTMDQLADIMAFRVLVPTVSDCYRALGQLHQNYPTVMGRFKDYMSTPKRNGYQSLHTDLIGPENHRIEVQIRTPEMHGIAENGVAAHWSYKNPNNDPNTRKIKWINELVAILDEEAGADEFLEHTKMDLYHDQVFCFTPRGDLISLPKGATAVDFAYAVHTKIGEHCVGVNINGRNRQLATVLENGDQVDILTAVNGRPRAEWESFVLTGRARSAIRRYVRSERASEFGRIGRTLVERIFREHDKPFDESALNDIVGAFGVSKVDDLLALVGEDRVEPAAVLEKVFPDVALPEDGDQGARSRLREEAPPQLKIRDDHSGTAVTMARCCHPLPGEAIVGIFTTGKGVTVHKIGCSTLSKFNDTPELWIDVQWEHSGSRLVLGRLEAVLSNEPGSLASLAAVISQQGGNISNIHLADRSPDFFRFELDLEVKDAEHMRAIIAVLQANKYVESVVRADNG